LSAARPPLLDRLAGLETEYAIRFRPRQGASRPSNFFLYRRLVAALSKRVLTAEAHGPKQGVFVANGGAVWFEMVRYTGGSGLIEGSTPECRGPRQLLAYQRAQDRLVADAAAQADVPGRLALIKNDRDSQNNIYGAQENYEANVATGWWLLCWRIGLVLLVPLLVTSWLALAALVVLMLLYLLAAGVAYLVLLPWLKPRRRRAVRGALFGGPTDDDEQGVLPEWLDGLLAWLTPVLFWPTAGGLFLLVWGCGFRQARRGLLPHLVSRSILGGSGSLDEQGRFHLADKAGAVNCVVGFSGIFARRPIYGFGHFLNLLLFRTFLRPRDYARMFRPRQRLQLCLGDSNLAEEAEYLRIGTTMLVLDAIEAGCLPGVPRLWRPVQALRAIAADPTLTTQVRAMGGRRFTAIELQRFYHQACRDYVERLARESPDDPRQAEARDVLDRWGRALDDLRQDRQQLVGRVDWVTKEFLLDQAGNGESHESRKKIDLCYHELTAEGYFDRLRAAGQVTSILSTEELDRAMRTPPAGTPATMRGHILREFSAGDGRLVVDWNWVVIGRGKARRVFDLTRAAGRPKADPPRAD
jgi:hypothetical protein